MKLLTKTNRYYLIYTALLLAIGGIVFYYIISSIIRNEVTEVLQTELDDFLINVQKDTTRLTQDKTIEFEIARADKLYKDRFSDTLLREGTENEVVPYLQLTAYRDIHYRPYRIILRESMIESDEILFGVSIYMVILFLILLIGLFVLNNYLSKKLWKPFYSNLDNVKSYEVSEPRSLNIIPSDIREFQELNDSLVKMTNRIKQDYVSLRQFTENVSHEIQTPLAVIKLNVDWLIQHTQEEKQLDNLTKIEMAVNRITRTNQALLLLTKIENNQFEGKESISINDILQQALTEYEDFIEAKQLEVSIKESKDLIAQEFNRQLFQILVNNLISNAVKHNVKNGYIHVYINPTELIIENSGIETDIEPRKLFSRFAKGDPSSQSSGLGLAIIETVARVLHLRIEYSIDRTRHRFVISIE